MSYPGRSRLVPERATRAVRPGEREVSRGQRSGASREGPNDGKGETPADLEDAMSQKSDQGPSAQTVGAVKPQRPRLRVEASPAAVVVEELVDVDSIVGRSPP